MKRVLAILCIAVGLTCVGIALGFIYKYYVRREGAWVEIQSYDRHGLDESTRQQILEAWDDPGNFMTALTAGAAGVGLFGAGCLLTLFESRWFKDSAQSSKTNS